jgi:hypothetical protein
VGSNARAGSSPARGTHITKRLIFIDQPLFYLNRNLILGSIYVQNTHIIHAVMKTHFLKLLSLLLLISSPAVAQKDIYINSGLYRDLEFNELFVGTVDIGVSFYINERFAIIPEVNLCKFGSPQYSSLGAGFRPAIRTYPLVRPHYAIYLEFKGGIMFMFPEYKFQSRNFTYVSTIGADIKISPKGALRAAIGYHHFSNAKYSDHSYNSYSDGLGGYIGYVFKLK